MKLSQSSVAILGILCTVIWLACDNADDRGVNSFTIDRYLLWTTKIAFVSDREGNADIYVMNVGGTDVVNLTNHEADEYDPAWSPDGTKIAFVSSRRGDYDIYVMNADGTDAVNLTNHEADEYDPAWSPDGTKIAFNRSNGRGDVDIYVMDTEGTNVVNITSGYHDFDPAWSPDGKKIVFSRSRTCRSHE